MKKIYGLVRNLKIESVAQFDSSELEEAHARLYAEASISAQWQEINPFNIIAIRDDEVIVWGNKLAPTPITKTALSQLKQYL